MHSFPDLEVLGSIATPYELLETEALRLEREYESLITHAERREEQAREARQQAALALEKMKRFRKAARALAETTA